MKIKLKKKKRNKKGKLEGLPWLRICLPTHGTQVSIPGHGIKIPHATGQLISDSTTTEPMCSKT